MIGRRCKHSNVFSRPVLIARNLSGKPDFKPRDLSQEIYCGGYISVDPPLPIPNREVKHTGADGSAIPSVRVGSCRFSRPSSRQDPRVSFLFAQHERTLTGASPQTALIVGRLQPKTRVSAVRRNLKEVGGKRLARCTRTWYKAERQGQCCTRSKSPITIRTADSKPSGYKPERVRP